ncbi:MAG: hypothetical protein IPM14_03905 [bacterium]|nr:hypothetical protein [bacterium]
MKLLNVILLSISFFVSAFSQTYEYFFSQLTDAEGLSQSTIFSMIQDRYGYLWLGTIDGLNRYDGYEFKVYSNDPSDLNSISDNFISSLYEDSDGYIWVGTVNGYLNRFDRKSEKFKRYYINDFFSSDVKYKDDYYEYPLAFSRNQNNSITSIAEDSNGDLWIGTWGNGLIIFDRKNSNSVHIFNDVNNDYSLSSNRITDILIEKNNSIWVATFGGGLNKLFTGSSKINSEGKEAAYKFLHYNTSSINNSSISDNKITCLHEGRTGNIWIGTFDGGLNKLDAANKMSEPDKARFLQYTKSRSSQYSISANTVMAIQQDSDGYLWIGTFGGGINRFDTKNNIFVNFKRISTRQNPFMDEEILSLFIDRSGVLWAGSHLGEGVTKIQKFDVKFETINRNSPGNLRLNDDVVWALFKDSSENLWIGTYRGGANLLNFSKQQSTIYSKHADGIHKISDNHIRSFAEDKSGNIWIGTYSGGLNRINHSTKRIDIFKNEPGNQNSLSANQVLDIYVESEKVIWVATFGGGLNKLTFSDNSSGKPDFKAYSYDPNDKNSISENRVYTILRDSKNNFWIGTYGGGLNKFDNASEIFRLFTSEPNNQTLKVNEKILSIFESPNGIIWIGTSGSGLVKYDPTVESFKTFSTTEGLTSTVIYGILEDNQQNLWLSTDDGIFLFNTSSEKFTQFKIEDGVQSLEFSGGAYFKDSDGFMYFGGINGFNYFHPDSITISNYEPSIVITKIKVMDVEVKGEPEELILSYDQNFISIEFSALDFYSPKRNKYSYFLEGFQKSWISTDGSNRTAIYTNLPAGEFTFMVKGTNADGIWNEDVASIKIIINPPFYQTWWFVTLIIMAVAFLIYYLGTIRIKSQLEIERLKLKIASDLHDNIGAGLTEISILSEVAERNENNSGNLVKQDLQKISNTARQLVDSMSDIVWVVNPQRDSLYDLILKLKDSYNEFFSSIGISFHVNNVEKSDDIKLPMEYKQNLLLLFKEAINNAIKHSGCKKITLEAFYENDTIKITLKDDGQGFDLNDINFGNGIKNMEERAKKINGTLNWESSNNSGTLVSFNGKLGKINRIKSIFG